MKAIVMGAQEINLLENMAKRYSQLMYDISQPWEFDDGYDTHEEAMQASIDYIKERVLEGDTSGLQDEIGDFFEDGPNGESDMAIREYGEYIAIRNMLDELAKQYV